jgi:hypothetical protein
MKDKQTPAEDNKKQNICQENGQEIPFSPVFRPLLR